MNEFEDNKADTPERTVSERHIEAVRQQGGMFVEGTVNLRPSRQSVRYGHQAGPHQPTKAAP
jgi:hypothetical protein